MITPINIIFYIIFFILSSGWNRSNVSDAALVATRRDGKQIYYRIDSPRALAVMQVLHEQFCNPKEAKSP